MTLVVPGRLSDAAHVLRHVLVSEQRNLTENRANGAGATLRIALSDQCLWVSNPKRWGTSWKVVSICQRLTNQPMIRPGSATRSVQRSA